MDTKEITTCEVADSVEAYRCITEEQCDDCFMADHLKECDGCEHYDHPPMTVVMQPTCECYNAPSVDELINHLSGVTGFRQQVAQEDEGQVYDENGELDRTAADYSDGLPDATCEEDEQITDNE